MVQQAQVEALAHLPVGIAEPVVPRPVVPLLAKDGEVACLEKECLSCNPADVEGAQQFLAGEQAVQRPSVDAAVNERLHKEGWCAGFVPPRVKLPVSKQQEHVKGVVDFLVASPAVAVVPAADPLAIKPRKLRRKDLVEVALRVAANGREGRIKRDVDEIVEAREQADFGESAHSREEAEADMGVAVLDRRVQAAQVVAVGPRDARLRQGVQDRLVILVDQYRNPLPGPAVQRPDQVAEALRTGVVSRRDSGFFPIASNCAIRFACR